MNGVCQRLIVEEIPYISECSVENSEMFLKNVDLFILGNAGKDSATILESVDPSILKIDRVRLPAPFEKREKFQGICW